MAMAHESSLQTLQSAPNFRRTSAARPLSYATEIFDTDSESDYEDDQFAADSVTTASTPRDVPTPESDFHFHIDEKPVHGPSGPHLFRSSMDSQEFKSLEVDVFLAKTPTNLFFDPASTLVPQRKDTPFPGTEDTTHQTKLSSINSAVSELDEAEVRSWTPPDVVRWMQNAGFDDSVVEKFYINDISGAILLELQAEDLKELDIQSFGKRRRLMHSIQNLRDSVMISTAGTHTPPPGRDLLPSESPYASDSTPAVSETDETKSKHHRHRRHHHGSEDVTPSDSISIVAIEQLLPKIHHCSKGEACQKWQKQQRKIARYTEDLPLKAIPVSSTQPTERTTRNLPLRGRSLPGQELMPTPSIVASSDVLGPQSTPHIQLSQEKLNELRQQDPQENVRQYLGFQHLNRLQPVSGSTTVPSPPLGSPDSTKSTAPLSENLRHLPKLTIPATQPVSANLSAQRTITPSVIRKHPNFNHASLGLAPQAPDLNTFAYGQDYYSPSDFYRNDDIYRQQTPASEIDIPVTAIPAGPIARDISQSVPPHMCYGHGLRAMADPITRPVSTKALGDHCRNPSFNIPALNPVDGTVMPIDTLEDFERTPRVFRTRGDVNHSGWMKKRKTTRFLRHEWDDHHFTLKGTRLAMFEDEEASRRDSKALECIDVDDYAVACSSLASSSKLTAAFKKTILNRKDTSQDGTAFAFSLINAPNGNSTMADRKAFFSSGKSHHFAVKNRDERIDWMRELMLAKALKRGKESGDSVHINGHAL